MPPVDEQGLLKLVRDHAPILWLHEREAFHPVDVEHMVKLCRLYRKGRLLPDGEQPQNLAALAKVRSSKNCELRLPDLDMDSFRVPAQDARNPIASGPAALERQARRLYGHKLAQGGFPRKLQPKYYARVTEVNLHRTDLHADTRGAIKAPQNYHRYRLIEYFFFFVYNDGWNQHQGDWDAMVHLYLPDENHRSNRRRSPGPYMVTHLHKINWPSRLDSGHRSLGSWIKVWRGLKKRNVGPAFKLGEHPFVFIARGAHAGYPTPGFSVHGLDVRAFKRLRLLALTDERHIGGPCILPKGVEENEVRKVLKSAGVDTSQRAPLRFAVWRNPTNLVPWEDWPDYAGRWGAPSQYAGWSGPKDPPISRPPHSDSLHVATKAFREGDGYAARDALTNVHDLSA